MLQLDIEQAIVSLLNINDRCLCTALSLVFLVGEVLMNFLPRKKLT